MEVTYRRATVEDVEALTELRIQFLAEHFAPPKDSEYDALKKELRQYFTENIPGGTFIAWLATSSNRVVATSGMVMWQMPANHFVKNGKQGYILNMYTLAEFRGKGICTALLDKLIAEARDLGLSRLHLHASKMGEPIYRKRGFREPGDVELILSPES
jgi:ribosomal protein S18 acetylase RimI-like enzyme